MHRSAGPIFARLSKRFDGAHRHQGCEHEREHTTEECSLHWIYRRLARAGVFFLRAMFTRRAFLICLGLAGASAICLRM